MYTSGSLTVSMQMADIPEYLPEYTVPLIVPANKAILSAHTSFGIMDELFLLPYIFPIPATLFAMKHV